MKDEKLPDIGEVATEIIDGLRIRLSRSGREEGLPILFTCPWPESIYAFHRILPYFVEAGRDFVDAHAADATRAEHFACRTQDARTRH